MFDYQMVHQLVFFAQNDDSNLKLLKHFTSFIFLVCFSQRYKVSFVTLRALLLHGQIGLKLKHLHLIVGLPKIFQTESIRIDDSSSPHECWLNLVQFKSSGLLSISPRTFRTTVQSKLGFVTLLTVDKTISQHGSNLTLWSSGKLT